MKIIVDAMGGDNAPASNVKGALAAVREHPELRELGVSLSIGMTRIEETDDMDSLVSRADEALYHSKNDGRDRLSFI